MRYWFICYEKCTTCQKAKKWLDAQGVEYSLRPIREENPTAGELAAWHQASGLPLKRFFNTSGLLYKSMELSKKLPELGEEEQLALLATDGMLVRRPLLVSEDGSTVLVGFREPEWERILRADCQGPGRISEAGEPK